MGIDITHIVRHDFDDIENEEASMKFALDTIQLLKDRLHIDDPLESFHLYCNKEYDNEITFRLPFYGVEFTLHKKCWQIESFDHYCQIVMHSGDYFLLREMMYDIATALGNDEIWYAEEYYTWNGGPMEEVKCSFEEWITFTRKKLGREIPEFDYDGIISQGDVDIPEYEPVYHDTFAECKIKHDALKKRLLCLGYQPIELSPCGGNIRCVRLSDKSVHLLNSKTLEPLICGTPQAYYFDYPSSMLVVKQNDKYALFDLQESKQLTEFVSHPFRKQWNKGINDNIAINEEIGRYYFFMYGKIYSEQLSRLS